MKRCAVVCNGTISDYQWLSDALSGYEAVFAADGGFDHCRRAGVKPAAVLGDMDSLAGKGDDTTALIRFPAEKDLSDMELAVDHALVNGYGAVDVFGALGGRIDHELCNVIVCAKHPGTLRLLDERSVIIAIDAGKSLSGAGSPGDIITLAALDDGARCTTGGLRYALRDEFLARGSRGLSNVIEGGSFSVAVSSGTVLVIQLKGDHRNS